jgi:hypothetical protein
MPIDFVTVKPAIQARRQITEDMKKYNVSSMILSPTRWASFNDPTPLNWQRVKFDQQELHQVPDDEFGIYTFIVDAGVANHPHCSYLLYLGKAEDQSLRTRIRQYFYEPNNPKGRGPIQDMIIEWHPYLYLCFTPVADVSLIDDLENALLEAFVPPMNQNYKGTFGAAYRAWRQR